MLYFSRQDCCNHQNLLAEKNKHKNSEQNLAMKRDKLSITQLVLRYNSYVRPDAVLQKGKKKSRKLKKEPLFNNKFKL